MYLFWMIVIGLAVGVGARVVMPGRAGGVITTVTLGLAGSLLAGFFGRALGFYQGTFDGPGMTASLLGAVLVLVAFRFAMGPRTGAAP